MASHVLVVWERWMNKYMANIPLCQPQLDTKPFPSKNNLEAMAKIKKWSFPDLCSIFANFFKELPFKQAKWSRNAHFLTSALCAISFQEQHFKQAKWSRNAHLVISALHAISFQEQPWRQDKRSRNYHFQTFAPSLQTPSKNSLEDSLNQ